MAKAPSAPAPAGDAPDPSMDDILASIRRILNDDDKTPKPTAPEVLVLDPSMIVEEGARPEDAAAPPQVSAPMVPMEALLPSAAPAPGPELHLAAQEPLALATTETLPQGGSPLSEAPLPAAPLPAAPVPAFAPVSHESPAPDVPLVAPAAAAAAANSVGSLVRTLAAERSAMVTRGGLTIEDLVREEVRPVLKEWLDTHLPPLVERMVRAELERVVGRSV